MTLENTLIAHYPQSPMAAAVAAPIIRAEPRSTPLSRAGHRGADDLSFSFGLGFHSALFTRFFAVVVDTSDVGHWARWHQTYAHPSRMPVMRCEV